MKQALFVVGGAMLVVAAFAGIILAASSFSSAVTPVEVVEVEPGIRCAKMVTADGAAISCWKE